MWALEWFSRGQELDPVMPVPVGRGAMTFEVGGLGCASGCLDSDSAGVPHAGAIWYALKA
jgi:hypothetical protein